MDTPEGEERDKGAVSLFNEIIVGGKKLDIKVHEANKIPISMQKHIIMKHITLPTCIIES